MTNATSIPSPDDLRQQMGEAAMLPPDDARRLAVVRDIVAAGEWARREWIDLIAADERMRLELMTVDVPAGLIERLAQVPEGEEFQPPFQLVRQRRWTTGMAIAAALAIAGLTWVVVTQGLGGRGTPADAIATTDNEMDLRLKTMAVLALDNYNTKREPVVKAADTHELAHAAPEGGVAFKPEPPQLPPHMKLVSTGRCAIGGHAVVCYHVLDDGKPRTIYQFSPKDYALPAQFATRTITPPEPWYDKRKGEVTFWTDDHRAYAIVNPTPGDDENPDTVGVNDDGDDI